MIMFFLEVIIFGRCVSRLDCFNHGDIMSIAMTFSGTLFLSIATMDIIPQAIHNFNLYFIEKKSAIISTSSIHRAPYLPLTMIIAVATYLAVMFIDKILINHHHIQPQNEKISHEEQPKQQNNKEDNQITNNTVVGINWRPIILQVGMSIHAFFETLAVGLQRTIVGVLGLAMAILIHKWAQGLTLGLIYKKQGYSDRMITMMILFQSIVNVLGLIAGTTLSGAGHFTMAFFMSVSAGTFLYISTAEVLLQQIQSLSIKKMVTMGLAVIFVVGLVVLEKYAPH